MVKNSMFMGRLELGFSYKKLPLSLLVHKVGHNNLLDDATRQPDDAGSQHQAGERELRRRRRNNVGAVGQQREATVKVFAADARTGRSGVVATLRGERAAMMDLLGIVKLSLLILPLHCSCSALNAHVQDARQLFAVRGQEEDLRAMMVESVICMYVLKLTEANTNWSPDLPI